MIKTCVGFPQRHRGRAVPPFKRKPRRRLSGIKTWGNTRPLHQAVNVSLGSHSAEGERFESSQTCATSDTGGSIPTLDALLYLVDLFEKMTYVVVVVVVVVVVFLVVVFT